MARDNTGLVVAAVGLIGAYFLFFRKAAAAPTHTAMNLPGVAVSPTAVPGSMATTSGALAATMAIWANLTPTTGPDTGFVNFPTGSQAAAGLLPWATDPNGNYYTQWAGHIYLVNVAQMDANGNYNAGQLIS